MPARAPTPAELRRKARKRFATAQRVERGYLRQLNMLSRQIDGLVRMHAARPTELAQLLREYSRTITPWAKSVGEKMVAEVAKRDELAWAQVGKDIGRELRKELQDAPTGQALYAFLQEQVKLITSLPTEAAERVMHVAGVGMTEGWRADRLMADILETGKVTESRARLIARTETARVASGLTMVRAQHVGSTHYVWRTSGDADVRKSHDKMKNKVCSWAEPPEVEPGKHYHAGMFPNCRCYPEPILTDED